RVASATSGTALDPLRNDQSVGEGADQPLRGDPDGHPHHLRRQFQVLLARAGPLVLLGQVESSPS
ncbi:hypothetical protein, partial [Streptomyces rhizosphaerihabitans]|uniref:hypothetical protein n=1 Tax=Streptomyces rhizosphaerihabitans TaxID=1266770 RepID=UPI0021C2005C